MKGRHEETLARRGGAVELLRAPAALWGLVSRTRGWAYDRGLLPAHRVDAPVICVGNLTAGGTGKTPIVIHLARWFIGRGLRPGLLSRGYRSERLRSEGDGVLGKGAQGDEARLFAAALPGVLQVQNPDRVAGAQELVRRGADVVVMDDGFQHRRLVRDLDLVAVDATRPFGLPRDADGNSVEAFLPRGLLREGLGALSRASAILVTRSDQVAPEHLEALEQRLYAARPGLPQVRCRHAPVALVDAAGGRHGLERLAGREVDLLSAIGNPAAFEETVRSLGAVPREHRKFPDHHVFEGPELSGLGAAGSQKEAIPVVTTAKDAVKLGALLPGALTLEIELALDAGVPALVALLEACPRSRNRRALDSLHEGLHG